MKWSDEMRIDVREGVKKYLMDNIKPNFNQLSKQYGCDYRTVKRYYELGKLDQLPTRRKISKRGSKLDPYKEIIDEKLELGCSAMAIFKFIEKKGFEGKYTIVRDYCKQTRKEKQQKATIRVEHQPGIAAQVDWKEDMKLISKEGEVFTFNIFLYVLSYSRLKFITVTFDRKQDTLFECLDEAFKHTGGVPREIWFDNMRTVVDRSRSQFSKTVFNHKFYEFSKDAGFEPIACRPYRPQTKGIAESLARMMERLRVYNYEFSDGAELVELVNDFNDELNHEISQATDFSPNYLWETKEKEYLHQLNETLLNSYFEDDISRTVSRESMVQFRKCKYSVSPDYIGKEVQLEIDTDNHLHIYYKGERIKSHLQSDQKFNYTDDDMYHILKSDVFKHKEDEEIYQYIQESLSQYDTI